jgi:hypothetical protein
MPPGRFGGNTDVRSRRLASGWWGSSSIPRTGRRTRSSVAIAEALTTQNGAPTARQRNSTNGVAERQMRAYSSRKPSPVTVFSSSIA